MFRGNRTRPHLTKSTRREEYGRSVERRPWETMLSCIRGSCTDAGWYVQATVCWKRYEHGLTVSDQEMKELDLTKHDTCPNWNYTIKPRTSE